MKDVILMAGVSQSDTGRYKSPVPVYGHSLPSKEHRSIRDYFHSAVKHLASRVLCGGAELSSPLSPPMLCPPAHTEGTCTDKCGTSVSQTELYLPDSVCDCSKGMGLYPSAHIQNVSVGALPFFLFICG